MKNEVEMLEKKLSDDSLSIERKIVILLKYIGVSQSNYGYDYLREAIALSYKDREYLNSITKLLYPTIAKKFNTTIQRVERAIRHEIELLYDEELTDDFKEMMIDIFGRKYTNKKPRNSEFIAALVNYMYEVNM